MSLSVRTRFEVFKRDRFTCHYCGKHPPDVLLEVDHVTPIAAGGTDDITNLITACTDCNRGKAAQLLEEGSAPAVNRESIDDLRERVEQAKAYIDLVAVQRNVIDDMVDRVNAAWASAFRAQTIENEQGTTWTLAAGRFPEERSLRPILHRLSLDRVLEAVDIAAGWNEIPDIRTLRYFYGTCWRMIKDPTSAPPWVAQPTAGGLSDDELSSAEVRGREQALHEVGEHLKHWAQHGYSSLQDAVLSWFPDDD